MTTFDSIIKSHLSLVHVHALIHCTAVSQVQSTSTQLVLFMSNTTVNEAVGSTICDSNTLPLHFIQLYRGISARFMSSASSAYPQNHQMDVV